MSRPATPSAGPNSRRLPDVVRGLRDALKTDPLAKFNSAIRNLKIEIGLFQDRLFVLKQTNVFGTFDDEISDTTAAIKVLNANLEETRRLP